MILVALRKTCVACPAQWEAIDADGNWLYIRYRHGWLTVSRGADYGSRYDEDLLAARLGDSLDGVLSEEQMLDALGAEFEPHPDACEQLDSLLVADIFC